MIDLSEENNLKNAELLFEGMWYSNLPDIFDVSELIEDLSTIIENINNKKYDIYKFDKHEFIVDWKGVKSPKYIRNPGVEAITFYDFKNNKSLREMQIPNMIYYISFIYNTMLEFENIFCKLYIEENNKSVVENSNSYLVFEEAFAINTYDSEEWVSEGTFTTKNNKINVTAIIEKNKRKVLHIEKDYMHFLKMDIESFFPNMYTHNFEKIAEKPPFEELILEKRYFSFLDRFNQRINNNQTKGIPAGVFSSHIAAELCMLCIDHEIKEYLAKEHKDIAYIRYVDDLSFFSDSKDSLTETSMAVQNILNKYRLRINGNKTENINCIFVEQPSYIDEIVKEFCFLNNDIEEYDVDLNDFFSIKKYVGASINRNRISQCKTFFSLFFNKLKERKINVENIKSELFYYLVKLIFSDEQLSANIYQAIDIMLSVYKEENFIKALSRKQDKIDSEYADTLIQIWHYYVFFKHCNNTDKTKIIDNLKERFYNPLIIACMVNYGEKTNEKLFKYIITSYQADIESSNWRDSIMYSKWWLPLFKIKRYDSYNYHSFMNSNNFNDVLKDFSKHTLNEIV